MHFVFIYCFYVYGRTSVYHLRVPDARGGQKNTLNPLDLDSC